MFELFVIYKGDVQGVGFRYKTKDLAEKHGIKGTVRNLPDGAVELIAQSESQDKLENFSSLLEKEFTGYIQENQKKVRSPSSLYSSFSIIR